VPTPVSHAAVGFAIGAWTQRAPPTRALCFVAAACAALPDIDYFGWPVAHRGITHSLVFALSAAVVTAVLVRRPENRARVALVLGLAVLSHSLLDGLSSYSVGIEYFAPFSAQRYRLAWTPLRNPQFVQETFVVLLPALILGWLAFRVRRRT
jgi:inner membrane protein